RGVARVCALGQTAHTGYGHIESGSSGRRGCGAGDELTPQAHKARGMRRRTVLDHFVESNCYFANTSCSVSKIMPNVLSDPPPNFSKSRDFLSAISHTCQGLRYRAN